MSWLINDLANKAEALLDKVDQTAASALKEEDEHRTTYNNTVILPDNSENQSFQQPSAGSERRETSPSGTKASYSRLNKTFPVGQSELSHNRVSSLGSHPSSHQSTLLPRVASVPSLKRKPLEDEKLFEFLNSSKAAEETTANSPATVTMATRVTSGLSSNGSVGAVTASEREATHNEPNEHQSLLLGNKRVSQLELENKMLKTEVASLNEEARNVFEKFRISQKEIERMRLDQQKDYQRFTEYKSIADRLSESEHDHIEQLKAKDSQLAVLRVRMQEADAQLSTKTGILNKLQGDNQRILQDHSASAGLTNNALDEMRMKFNEMEAERNQERSKTTTFQNENSVLQQKLKDEQQSMAFTLKSLQNKLSEEKGKHREMSHSLKLSQEAAASAQRDLTEYKEKAAKILQAKERLIASLKDGGDTVSTIVACNELDELKMERDGLRTEQQQLRYRLDQIKLEWRDNDHQRQNENDEQTEQIRELESSLEEQNSTNQKLTRELEACQNELQSVRQDHTGVKGSFQRQLMEKENEIVSLKQQIFISSTSSSSQQELEGRIHSLTDTLIQKQTLVEALSTEKNSLVLQLERLERQYRSVQENLSKQMTLFQNDRTGSREQDNEEFGGVSRSHTIASIMPTPVQRSNHMKSTLNTIDRFSVRLGRMLRQYPAARLFFIVYMFCLHLWVTFVLLTYQPEMHDGHSAMPKPPSR